MVTFFWKMARFSMRRLSSRDAGSLIAASRSSTWMSLDAMSERRGSSEEGFGVRALRGEMADKDTRVIFDRMISR